MLPHSDTRETQLGSAEKTTEFRKMFPAAIPKAAPKAARLPLAGPHEDPEIDLAGQTERFSSASVQGSIRPERNLGLGYFGCMPKALR